jgi:hypothetical protein
MTKVQFPARAGTESFTLLSVCFEAITKEHLKLHFHKKQNQASCSCSTKHCTVSTYMITCSLHCRGTMTGLLDLSVDKCWGTCSVHWSSVQKKKTAHKGSVYIFCMTWKSLTVWGLLILFNYVDRQNHFWFEFVLLIIWLWT